MKELNDSIHKSMRLILLALVGVAIIVFVIFKIIGNRPKPEPEPENPGNDTPVVQPDNPTPDPKKEETPVSYKEIKYDNFVYKLNFTIDIDYDLYFMLDGTIIIVSKEAEKINTDDNTYQYTGRIAYREMKCDFKKDYTKGLVLHTLEDISKRANGAKEMYDTRTKLKKNEKRILQAIVTNNEDRLTFDVDLFIKDEKEDISNAKGEVLFTNSKQIIDSSENTVVTKIATYLNNIINNEFDTLSSQAVTTSVNNKKVTGVNITLTKTYSVDNIVSFKLETTGRIDKDINTVRGYAFDIDTGDILKIPDDMKQIMLAMVCDELIKTDLYEKNKNNLIRNWRNSLSQILFNAGNWYLIDDKFVFIFPGSTIGIDKDQIIVEILNEGIFEQ